MIFSLYARFLLFLLHLSWIRTETQTLSKFKLVKDKHILSTFRGNNLLKTIKALDTYLCMIECMKIQSCTILIIDKDFKCSFYLSLFLIQNNSILIDSPGVNIYINIGFDEINRNLIHYWTFNGHLIDITSGVVLFNPRSVSFQNDRFNNPNSALKLGNLRLPDGKYLYSDFTFALWIKLSQCVGCDRLFGTGRYNFGFCLNIDMCDVKCHPNMDRIGQTNQSLPLFEWTHLAFTNNATDHLIYFNGQIQFSTTGKIFQTFSSPVFLGAYEGWGSPDATIDDLRIFNRSLSQGEIMKIITIRSFN